MDVRLVNFLHLLRRGNRLVYGVDGITKVNPRRLYVILVSEDASQNTKDKLTNYAKSHNLAIFAVTPAILAPFSKGNLVAIGVTSKEGAKKIITLMKEGDKE
jgi:hypothetical protein